MTDKASRSQPVRRPSHPSARIEARAQSPEARRLDQSLLFKNLSRKNKHADTTPSAIPPTLRLFEGPGRAESRPLTYPPTALQTALRQNRLAGQLLFSAKFICMGNLKNRLTATKPQNRPARIPAFRPGNGRLAAAAASRTKRKLPTLRWEIRTPRRSCELPTQTSIRLKLPTLRLAE